MAMAIMVPHYTVDDLATFPNDGNRYELLDGVLLVTPAPNTAHQVIATRFRRGWLRPCNGPDWRTSWVLASSCARRTRSYRRRTELPACRQIEHRKRIQRRCYPGFRTTVLVIIRLASSVADFHQNPPSRTIPVRDRKKAMSWRFSSAVSPSGLRSASREGAGFPPRS
jgi:hypothetical protein